MTTRTKTAREDIYTRITNGIVEQLERGVRPWFKPWSAEHTAGRITRPLRHNGEKYSGINVLSLWMSAELQGFVWIIPPVHAPADVGQSNIDLWNGLDLTGACGCSSESASRFLPKIDEVPPHR